MDSAKGNIPEGNFLMNAKTFYGLEEILAAELRALGAMQVELGNRVVSFWGDKGFMYKANLCLRTALSILVPIHTARVYREEQLYKAVYAIPWERHISSKDTFSIDTTVARSDIFTNSHYTTLRIKDAIVDRVRDKMNERPSIDRDNPTLKVNVHINGNNLTVSLDSSGDSLHKRGYRSATNIAPINEVLAAGLIALSGWNGASNLLDPMCGSGTILIEAAIYAANIPAGINRRAFGFEGWKDFDAALFDQMRENALKKVKDIHFKIQGYDKAPSAVEKTIENVKNARLEEFIEVERKDFFHTKRPEDGSWTLIFNPPYGVRLDSEDTLELYKAMGDHLKSNYQDTTAWMISGALAGLKNFGLRHSRSIPLMNANIEARFVKYELYGGSRKTPKTTQDINDQD